MSSLFLLRFFKLIDSEWQKSVHVLTATKDFALINDNFHIRMFCFYYFRCFYLSTAELDTLIFSDQVQQGNSQANPFLYVSIVLALALIASLIFKCRKK